jgi:AraC-like DNA-binding protein
MSMIRQPLEGPTLQTLGHRQRIDWHDHAKHQLIYPSRGVLRISTGGGSWVVPPLRAVWVPAGVAHAHEAHGLTEMRTLSFRADVDPFGAARPGRLAEPVVVGVTPLLRELIIAMTDDAGPESDERADLERIALRQLAPTPDLRFHLPLPRDERLRDVAAILAADPADDRPLGQLGRSVGASERTLSRLFRRDTGLTFPQWRAQLRLQHALTLLAGGEQVTTAALACGYRNPSAFIAAFRDAFGTTPARYGRGRPGAAAAQPASPTTQATPKTGRGRPAPPVRKMAQ